VGDPLQHTQMAAVVTSKRHTTIGVSGSGDRATADPERLFLSQAAQCRVKLDTRAPACDHHGAWLLLANGRR
jgi:hypothetical protein